VENALPFAHFALSRLNLLHSFACTAMQKYDNFWCFQPGQFASKLAKDVCHDLIYFIAQVYPPI